MGFRNAPHRAGSSHGKRLRAKSQTNELICWLIERHLSIKSLSIFTVLKKKKDGRKRKERQNEGKKERR